MIIERTVEIRRPVAEVYGYLCDEARLLEWRHGLLRVERLSAPGPFDGSLYLETIATPFGPQNVTVRLNTKPFRSISFCVVAGAVRAQGTMLLRPLGMNVELTFRVESDPLAALLMRENVERSVANLKRILDPNP